MMDCPKCGQEMDFEEAKSFHGTWYCECEFEAEGSHIPCDAEYFTDSASPVACDWEDAFAEKNGGYIPPEEAKDMAEQVKLDKQLGK